MVDRVRGSGPGESGGQAMIERTTINEAALAAFMRGKAEIDDLLTRIQAASADHFGAEPEHETWSDAGSLGFVTERLEEIAEFLRV
jgi:hypothetical protein